MAASAGPAADFWAAAEDCIVCGSTEFEPGFGPKTLVTCDCCLDKGVHVACWQRRSAPELTKARLESPSFQWFCSEVSRRAGAAGGGGARREGLPRLARPRLAPPLCHPSSLQACQRVSERLVELTGVQRPLAGAAGSAGGESEYT